MRARRLILAALLGLALAAGLSAKAAAAPRPIYIWNDSTVISDATIADALPVWQRALSEDFAPAWGVDATLVFTGSELPPANAWSLEVTDWSDYWDALAYHGVNNSDVPSARVFARTILAAEDNWEVGLTHELWEMLADPYIDRTVMWGDGIFYALEVADPVEAWRLAYWRPSPTGVPVAISDFVTENWFRPNAGPPYDFAGHVKRPGQILKGGYMGVWRGGGTWTYPSNWHRKRVRFQP